MFARFSAATASWTLRFLMAKKAGFVFLITVAMSLMLGCGGVGSAPINGLGALGQVAVSISPQSMTITTGTTQAFTATVINSSVTGVGWLVNGFPGGINPTDGTSPFGTIDKSGNYTAPPFIPEPPTVTVTAVAMADNSATANASVSINGTPSPVSISPLSANLEVGGIALFTASVKGSDPSVTWLVERCTNGERGGRHNPPCAWCPGPGNLRRSSRRAWRKPDCPSTCHRRIRRQSPGDCLSSG